MTTYNVTLTSKMVNQTEEGTPVTAETEQEAQKAANLQAAELSRQDHNHAWDWKAVIIAV